MFQIFPQKKKTDFINILVVDDDPLLMDLLKEYGSPSKVVNIVYCSNAEDAVNTVLNTNIHGVLSDVNMNNMEYLDRFLFEKASDIPIYRFSGDCPRHLNIRLVKPFNCDEYRSALIELAGLARIVKNAA